jgi:hypothetical protein
MTVRRLVLVLAGMLAATLVAGVFGAVLVRQGLVTVDEAPPKRSARELSEALLGRMHGTVRDKHGRPVAGIEVHAKPRGKTEPWTIAVTDPAGRYSFELPAGTFEILDWSASLGHHRHGSVEVRVGDDVVNDFVSAPRVTLHGTIHGSDGRPVAGTVRIPDSRDSESVCVKAGADGRFAKPLLPEGVFALTMTAPGFATRRVEAALFDGDTEPLDVAIVPEAKLEVRVVNAAGGPVPNARMGAQQGGFHAYPERSSGRDVFRFDGKGLDAGPVELVVDDGRRAGAIANLTLAPTIENTLEVVIHDLSTLEIRIANDDGEPASGLCVKVSPLKCVAECEVARETEDKGTYRTGGIFQGRCSIQVIRRAGSSPTGSWALWTGEVVVQPCKNEVSATLARPAKISGRVSGPENNVLVEGVALVTSGGSSAPLEAVSSADCDQTGRFVFEDVPPGEVELRVYFFRSRAIGVRRFHVDPGATIEGVTIEPKPASSIGGFLCGPGGLALSQAPIQIQRTGAPCEHYDPTTASDGRFTSGPLEPGDHTITVADMSGIAAQLHLKAAMVAPRTVHVGAGELAEVDLRTTPGEALR